ncbi:DUF5672 family protein [Sphaerotilus mobilis]|uniref:DUF5672 domain-containing protein n=1 Tax=Sphaerotilus mobilis TaxID=47994 RepID=A0A4Q7LAL9_9BURK|nr:DUF5672 family protein [Sphaerotilus mobilis]RZS47549.1 hypothetical protein EV685_3759 [Sphaerotilus mobilis]
MRLNLPDVTLACVDTRLPELAIEALQRCLAQVDFGRSILFTDAGWTGTVPEGIERIDLVIDSVPAYSRFMLRGLDAHVRTSHVLVVQWDGYVLDASAWDPRFLEFDYLGAPLRGEPTHRSVGNGGFSLRSKKLMQAMQDPTLAISHPEDLCICHENRERLEREHAIRFAPVELASRFAHERVAPTGPTFGFHGLFNMDRVMTPGELDRLIARLPDNMARGLDVHDLCRQLIRVGRLKTARQLLDMRLRLGMRDRRTWRLRGLMAWARLSRAQNG